MHKMMRLYEHINCILYEINALSGITTRQNQKIAKMKRKQVSAYFHIDRNMQQYAVGIVECLVLFEHRSIQLQEMFNSMHTRKMKSESSVKVLSSENNSVQIKKKVNKRIMSKCPLYRYLDRVRNQIPITFLEKCSKDCRSGVKTGYITRSAIAYSAWKYIEKLHERIEIYESLGKLNIC